MELRATTGQMTRLLFWRLSTTPRCGLRLHHRTCSPPVSHTTRSQRPVALLSALVIKCRVALEHFGGSSYDLRLCIWCAAHAGPEGCNPHPSWCVPHHQNPGHTQKPCIQGCRQDSDNAVLPILPDRSLWQLLDRGALLSCSALTGRRSYMAVPCLYTTCPACRCS